MHLRLGLLNLFGLVHLEHATLVDIRNIPRMACFRHENYLYEFTCCGISSLTS